jgi:hypothetical protein
MRGLGNDFVVIDAVHQPITLTPARIRFLADRHLGTGYDPLPLVEPARHPGSISAIVEGQRSEVRGQRLEKTEPLGRFAPGKGRKTGRWVSLSSVLSNLCLLMGASRRIREETGRWVSLFSVLSNLCLLMCAGVSLSSVLSNFCYLTSVL